MTEQELLTRIRLRPGKLLVSKPTLMGMQGERMTSGGIHMPEITNRARREWGFLVRVLKVGERSIIEGIVPGSIVLITEFAGMPIWYCGTEMNLWMIGLGDIVGVVTDTSGVRLENDPYDTFARHAHE